MVTGKIREIIRYPVKSLQGERVKNTKIKEYGLYGDRSHVFIDETKKKKYYMATYNQKLLTYRAEFAGEDKDTEYPDVKITAPDGRTFYWHDKECLEEFKKITGENKLYQETFTPQHVPIGPIEEEHVLILTTSSLKALERNVGMAIDWRSFRPNFIVSLVDDTPFVEDHWFGKTMKIGEVELQIKRDCERCMIVNIEPDTLKSNTNILKTIVKDRNNYFGVYASVIKTGKVSVGDEFSIV